ncbi:hypothetical protein [Noviherbaspirillum pedocola]|uniref:Uncharacterized protein n=1 Tax=Noviherbaspirillum pedocola TaxID=2801341 RepID=A0A934SZS3_9BURK|nr:hypothetical protein [Noviherbaspirillum pedocola]MBK4738694.1 hypothetical protein [Noviherbaspirillum pedocola]
MDRTRYIFVLARNGLGKAKAVHGYTLPYYLTYQDEAWVFPRAASHYATGDGRVAHIRFNRHSL